MVANGAGGGVGDVGATGSEETGRWRHREGREHTGGEPEGRAEARRTAPSTLSGREACGRPLTKRTRTSFKRAFNHVDAIHSASRATMAAAAEQLAAELKRVDHPLYVIEGLVRCPFILLLLWGDLQAPGRLASSDGLITCSASPVAQRLVS